MNHWIVTIGLYVLSAIWIWFLMKRICEYWIKPKEEEN